MFLPEEFRAVVRHSCAVSYPFVVCSTIPVPHTLTSGTTALCCYGSQELEADPEQILRAEACGVPLDPVFFDGENWTAPVLDRSSENNNLEWQKNLRLKQKQEEETFWEEQRRREELKQQQQQE